MSNNGARIEFEGNATADAELKFLPDGKPVCNFTVAVTPRVKDPAGNWSDGDASFYRVAAWQKLGEGCAEVVRKGTRVTVVGTLRPRPFEHNGEQRLSLDVTAENVGLSTLFMGGANGGGAPRQSGGQPQADPWATQQQQSGGWDQQNTSEAPF